MTALVRLPKRKDVTWQEKKRLRQWKKKREFWMK